MTFFLPHPAPPKEWDDLFLELSLKYVEKHVHLNDSSIEDIRLKTKEIAMTVISKLLDYVINKDVYIMSTETPISTYYTLKTVDGSSELILLNNQYQISTYRNIDSLVDAIESTFCFKTTEEAKIERMINTLVGNFNTTNIIAPFCCDADGIIRAALIKESNRLYIKE